MLMKAMKYSVKVALIAIVVGILILLSTSYANAVTVTEREPNDYMYQANSCSDDNDVILKGNVDFYEQGLSRYRDVDYFFLSIPYSAKLSIDVQSTDDLIVEFFTEDGCIEDTCFTDLHLNYNNNLGYAKRSTWYYITKCNYYISVRSYESRPVDYTIKLKYSDVKDEFSEPNDMIGSASLLKLGKTKKAILAETSIMYDMDDVDFVKVKVTSPGTYYMNYSFENLNSDLVMIFDEYNDEGERIREIGQIYEKEGISYTRGAIPIYLNRGTHYIKIHSYINRFFGSDYDKGTSYSLSITKKLTKPNNVKISKTGSSKIKLSWSEVKNADGYIIYRKSTKTGNYIKIGTTSKKSYVDTGAKRYQKNSYKIRAYRTMNGYKEKGFYSNVVSKWL